MYKRQVRAKPVTESYATKEGTTITRQTGEVEWTAIKRTSDGRYQAIADEGEGGFDSSKAATFLESVYTPTFTPEEVLKIATDLDMTGAQARWNEFAANPGAITTEAIITCLLYTSRCV